jgi:hypothetical protein
MSVSFDVPLPFLRSQLARFPSADCCSRLPVFVLYLILRLVLAASVNESLSAEHPPIVFVMARPNVCAPPSYAVVRLVRSPQWSLTVATFELSRFAHFACTGTPPVFIVSPFMNKPDGWIKQRPHFFVKKLMRSFAL